MNEARYLFPDDYMADPSVHVWDGKIWIYPRHDRERGIPERDNGDHFDMVDYHALSIEPDAEGRLDPMTGRVVDHGVMLALGDIPWAKRQLWDSDVAEKGGKYYLYFSAKDRNDVFHLGVAVSDTLEGPYVFKGPILEPQVGWTTHHCVTTVGGKWHLCHHDSVPSGGRTWLRSLKVKPLSLSPRRGRL